MVSMSFENKPMSFVLLSVTERFPSLNAARMNQFPAGNRHARSGIEPRPEAAMSVSRERTVSLWMKTEVFPDGGPLQRSDTADVVVVGSGIAGLSTAYELSRRGQDVVVLDRGPIGKGMTSRTTAHLTSICDDSFEAFIKVRGLEAAKLFYRSHAAAIDRLEAIHADEGIACNFRRLDGFLFPAIGSGPAEIDSVLDADRRVGVAVEVAKGARTRSAACGTSTRRPSILSNICAGLPPGSSPAMDAYTPTPWSNRSRTKATR
jgi:hypothetical protein